MKLFIGGPTRDMVPAAFATDAAWMYSKTKESRVWSSVTIGFIQSTYIHVGREQFLEKAIKLGATHVLWLDTDMSFPEDLALRLHMHDRPIVACNYRVRQASGLFTAARGDQRVPTTKASTGLESVDYVGMGAMLMQADVVAGLGRPWFRHGLNDFGGDVGEDVMFCRGLSAAGHTIYIDHDLSKEMSHLGLHAFDTIDEREAVAV